MAESASISSWVEIRGSGNCCCNLIVSRLTWIWTRGMRRRGNWRGLENVDTRSWEAFESISCTSRHEGQYRLTLAVNCKPFLQLQESRKESWSWPVEGQVYSLACGTGPWCVDREVQLGLSNKKHCKCFDFELYIKVATYLLIVPSDFPSVEAISISMQISGGNLVTKQNVTGIMGATGVPMKQHCLIKEHSICV